MFKGWRAQTLHGRLVAEMPRQISIVWSIAFKKVNFHDPSKPRFSAFQVLAQDFGLIWIFSDMVYYLYQTARNRLDVDIRP